MAGIDIMVEKTSKGVEHAMGKNKEIDIIPAKKELNAKKTEVKRVGVYCRVSTGSEDQESSFENQTEYYRDYIAKKPEWTLVDIYADKGLTGLDSKKRPEFQRLIKDCYDKKIDIIITKSVSRFSRNTIDTLTYVRKLKGINVSVIFEKEGLNTEKMDDEMQLTIMGMFAQAESETISKNVTWSIRKRFSHGEVKYGFLYGYERNSGTIVPDKYSMNIVKAIFRLFLDGLTGKDICEYLNETGVAGPKTDKWNRGVIYSILKNERYTGDALLQKTITTDLINHKSKRNEGEVPQYYVHNAHEGIIRREVFEATRKEIERRDNLESASYKHIQTKKGKLKKVPLAGMVRCGKCGCLYQKIHITRYRKGVKYFMLFWKCSNQHANTMSACDNCLVEFFQLVESVRLKLNEILSSTGENDCLSKEEIIEMLGARDPDIVFTLEYHVYKLDKELYSYVRKPMSTLSSFEIDQMKNIADDRQKYNDYIQNIKSQGNTDVIIKDITSGAFEMKTYNDIFTRKLIDEVKIIDESKITIVFKNGKNAAAELIDYIIEAQEQ